MNFKEVTGWIEAHPTESIVIGAGGLIAVLWLLGYFGGSSTASSSGSSNLASAYYAAEAQQAVVGGQIQVATIQSAAATAQNAANANAAVAIQKSQSKAATTINAQNASAATTINGQDDTAAMASSSNQLLATYSNNATALATVQSNNQTQATIAETQTQGSLMSQILGTIIPQEIASTASLPGSTGGTASIVSPFGNFIVSPAGGFGNLNETMAQGYSLDQALALSPLGHT